VNLLEWMAEELEMGEGDVFPALASYGFDMSVPELYLALVSGGRVAVAPPHLGGDGEEFAKFLRRYGATVVHATPTTWSLLLEAGYTGEGVKRCIGAEPLPRELFERLMEAGAGTALYNFYGPTETTVWSTYQCFRSKEERVVIGRPLGNTQVYILDKQGKPVPVGVSGEIHIGGDGVAQGYLKRAEMTAEKFIHDPFSKKSGARMYKTGDLGRWLEDGRIECIGRIDHQVKVRGFRVELGEIESVLGQHASVKESVVVVREDTPGDKRLVAYVVAAAGVKMEATELRSYLKQRLPEYMVPTAFMELERLPLTPNGKVDRKNLPMPEYERIEQGQEYAAAESPTEELIAGIWSEVLKLPKVGVCDNFFELGGHSLLATQVVSRIRQGLKVELPLRTLFEEPTVAGLAKRVERIQREQAGIVEAPLVRVSRDGSVPLSFAQQRLWFLDQLEPNNPFYNVPQITRVRGKLNVEFLERSLNEIVRRHEALRTIFQMEGQEPVQVIAQPQRIVFEIRDFTSLSEDEREANALQAAGEEVRRPFDLQVGPLFRAGLLKLAEQDHILILNTHHSVSDGWSMGILSQELTALYEAYAAGKASPLPELPLQYADFSAWQRKRLSGEALEQQVAYWKQQLAGAPTSLELPTDRVRPPVQAFRGAKRAVCMRMELLEALKRLGRSEDATLFMVLLAGFNVLLSRYTGQEDIVVGTPIAGRNRAETEKLIGFFVNTLVLRTELSGAMSFRELLVRVKETALSAYAHQEMPFEKLVEELNPPRDMSRSPVFQVMMALQNAPGRAVKMGDLSVNGFAAGSESSKFDLSLSLSEHMEGGLWTTITYNTDLFDATTVERMLGHFLVLLEGIVQDPERKIWELPLLTDVERQQVMVEWNQTRADYPDVCLHQLFEDQAKRSQDDDALICEDDRVSYDRLNRRANQLAHYLRKLGVKPGVPVGVLMDRSLDLVVALLGIWKAGGAYVALDPQYPASRIEFMLEDAAAEMLLTEQRYTGVVTGGVRQVCLDLDWDSIKAESEANVASGVRPEDLAYILHTSGSTGRPKGAMLCHRGIANCLFWMQERYKLDKSDKFLFKTSLNFDPSVWEIFWPLMVGGTSIIVSPHAQADSEYLLSTIEKQRATTVYFVPSMLSAFLDSHGLERGLGLRRVICGGEKMSQELIRRFFDCLPGVDLHHSYGPTETSIAAAEWTCERNYQYGVTPIGRPLGNTTFYVLDAHMQPVPIGVSGELYIGGRGVGLGYAGRKDLTSEKFIPDQFGRDGERLYRSGDRVRYLPDGNLEYIGRIDHQVKIRGYRIELGEIESVLLQHPGVSESVVLAREDDPGDKRLVAYTVPATAEKPASTELRSWLKERLPEYMVPAAFVELEELPLMPNGKVDRKRLPAPAKVSRSTENGDSPITPLQIRLAQIWEEVLKVQRVSLSDDFFDLGGHSLLAVKMMGRIREVFGKELPLALLFQSPTLGGLADMLQRERGKYTLPTLIPIRAEGSKPPLFCISRPNVNALGFIFLARSLPQNQPVYGLQSQMKEDGRFWTFSQEDYEKKAAEYIEAMLAVEPEGPYLLAGFCEGAHIGFEMARQLVAMGRPVAMLAILDAWPIENTIDRRRYKLRNFGLTLRRFARMSTKHKWKMISRKLLNRNAPIRVEVNGPHQITIDSQFQRKAAEQAEKRYWPGPDFAPTIYSGKITVFRTAHRDFHRIKDEQLGWGPRTHSGVEVVPIQGNHRLFLREPYVADLATKLENRIDAALLETSSKTSKAATSIA
jgi:amino acid adenylation domain-containing protein